MDAVLALENGTTFRGKAAGAEGLAKGEVVFNTSMTGYQEVLTDPSYAGQIVTMTCPEIGNYGVTKEDEESRGTQVAGFIIRSESPMASNWRADGSLRQYLVDNKIVAISDIDTRALTRVLRSAGVMRGVIGTGRVNTDELVDRARAIPQMEGTDLVKDVTCAAAFDWPSNGAAGSGGDEFSIAAPARKERPLQVAAYDFGMKWNILRRLTATRLPGPRVSGRHTGVRAAEDVAGRRVSEQRPRRSRGAVVCDRQRAPDRGQRRADVRHLPRPPDSGHAMGAKTFKLKFGHRGANHPVKELRTGKIEITSQNHGFAVDPVSLPSDLEVTHLNLYDQTIEGLRHTSKPAFCVHTIPKRRRDRTTRLPVHAISFGDGCPPALTTWRERARARTTDAQTH
jgi:carbamoyl-phosphate synthase small subunit